MDCPTKSVGITVELGTSDHPDVSAPQPNAGDDDAGHEVPEEMPFKPRPLTCQRNNVLGYVQTLATCDLAARDGLDDVTDACDNILYIANAEAVRCVGADAEDDVLDPCGAVDALIRVLQHERTVVVLAALGALQSVLRRPSHLDTAAKDRGLVEIIPKLMERLPNKEELQVEATAIGCVLVSRPHLTEPVLEGNLVAHTLAAMHRFPDNTAIQLQGLRLLATLCDHHPQMGVLLVQCGDVVQYVLGAMRRHPTQSVIADGATRVLSAMASFAVNHELLLSNITVPMLIKAMDVHHGNPSVVINCLTTASSLVRDLENTQKRDFVTRISKVLRTADRQQNSVLSSCAAFVVILGEAPDATTEFKMFCAQQVVPIFGWISQTTEDDALRELVERALRSLVFNKFRM